MCRYPEKKSWPCAFLLESHGYGRLHWLTAEIGANPRNDRKRPPIASWRMVGACAALSRADIAVTHSTKTTQCGRRNTAALYEGTLLD